MIDEAKDEMEEEMDRRRKSHITEDGRRYCPHCKGVEGDDGRKFYKSQRRCNHCTSKAAKEWQIKNKKKHREATRRSIEKRNRKLWGDRCPEECIDCKQSFPEVVFKKDWVAKEWVCSNCLILRKERRKDEQV